MAERCEELSVPRYIEERVDDRLNEPGRRKSVPSNYNQAERSLPPARYELPNGATKAKSHSPGRRYIDNGQNDERYEFGRRGNGDDHDQMQDLDDGRNREMMAMIGDGSDVIDAETYTGQKRIEPERRARKSSGDLERYRGEPSENYEHYEQARDHEMVQAQHHRSHQRHPIQQGYPQSNSDVQYQRIHQRHGEGTYVHDQRDAHVGPSNPYPPPKAIPSHLVHRAAPSGTSPSRSIAKSPLAQMRGNSNSVATSGHSESSKSRLMGIGGRQQMVEASMRTFEIGPERGAMRQTNMREVRAFDDGDENSRTKMTIEKEQIDVGIVQDHKKHQLAKPSRHSCPGGSDDLARGKELIAGMHGDSPTAQHASSPRAAQILHNKQGNIQAIADDEVLSVAPYLGNSLGREKGARVAQDVTSSLRKGGLRSNATSHPQDKIQKKPTRGQRTARISSAEPETRYRTATETVSPPQRGPLKRQQNQSARDQEVPDQDEQEQERTASRQRPSALHDASRSPTEEARTDKTTRPIVPEMRALRNETVDGTDHQGGRDRYLQQVDVQEEEPMDQQLRSRANHGTGMYGGDDQQQDQQIPRGQRERTQMQHNPHAEHESATELRPKPRGQMQQDRSYMMDDRRRRSGGGYVVDHAVALETGLLPRNIAYRFREPEVQQQGQAPYRRPRNGDEEDTRQHETSPNARLPTIIRGKPMMISNRGQLESGRMWAAPAVMDSPYQTSLESTDSKVDESEKINATKAAIRPIKAWLGSEHMKQVEIVEKELGPLTKGILGVCENSKVVTADLLTQWSMYDNETALGKGTIHGAIAKLDQGERKTRATILRIDEDLKLAREKKRIAVEKAKSDVIKMREKQKKQVEENRAKLEKLKAKMLPSLGAIVDPALIKEEQGKLLHAVLARVLPGMT